MTKSFSERLDEILLHRELPYNHPQWIGVTSASRTILELFRESLPNTPWKGEYKDCPAAWIRDSYKNFKAELLKRWRE